MAHGALKGERMSKRGEGIGRIEEPCIACKLDVCRLDTNASSAFAHYPSPEIPWTHLTPYLAMLCLPDMPMGGLVIDDDAQMA